MAETEGSPRSVLVLYFQQCIFFDLDEIEQKANGTTVDENPSPGSPALQPLRRSKRLRGQLLRGNELFDCRL